MALLSRPRTKNPVVLELRLMQSETGIRMYSLVRHDFLLSAAKEPTLHAKLSAELLPETLTVACHALA